MSEYQIKLDSKFKSEIDDYINNRDDIVFISYTVLDETEEKMKYALNGLLAKYNKSDFFTPLFSCTKELVSNAIKANAKKVLILEGAIVDPENQMDVVRKIKSILNEESLLEYGIKSKHARLSARTYYRVVNNRIVIEVINNVPLSGKDLTKINSRIKKSSNYDSLAEFYIENPDPMAEGMGLGLSMVVVLLKNIGYDWDNFTVKTDGHDKTYAKIEIPI